MRYIGVAARLVGRSVRTATAAAVIALLCQFAQAEGTPSGLNFGIGIGTLIPMEPDIPTYGDQATVAYPEFQMMFDISGIRLGPSVGLAFWEAWSGSDIIFIPVKFNVAVMPVRFSDPSSVFQPYA